jgi:hypothetical protein
MSLFLADLPAKTTPFGSNSSAFSRGKQPPRAEFGHFGGFLLKGLCRIVPKVDKLREKPAIGKL